MSSARCGKCRGLLPPWLEATGDQGTARCPNCGTVNKLGGGEAPAPEASPPAPAAPAAQPPPRARVNPLAQTMIGMPPPRPINRPAAPAPKPEATPSPVTVATPPRSMAAAAPQTAQANGAPARPVAKAIGAVTPVKRPTPAPRSKTPPPQSKAPPSRPEVKRAMTPPPAAAVPSAVAPEGEFSCDIDVDGAAPAGGPPSRQGLPSWVDAAASDDPSQDPVMATMAARRSRITRISAVAVGAVGLMVFAVLFLRHGDKPGARTPVAVSRSVPAPPPPPAVATREIAPASRPVAPAPRAVVPPPPRPVAVAPTPKPVAPPRPVAVAPPPKPVAPPPRPVHAEPPAPRPVAAAPRTVASVHNSDAPPAAAAPRAHSAASTEDNQRRAHEAYLRGNAKLLQGGIDEAIVAFKEALKLDPHDAIAERGLGLAYLQAGNAGQAVQHLRRYLRGAPGASDRPLIEKRIEQLSGR